MGVLSGNPAAEGGDVCVAAGARLGGSQEEVTAEHRPDRGQGCMGRLQAIQ